MPSDDEGSLIVLDFFRDGGPFMYMILLAALVHGAAIVLQLILARKFDLTPLLWAMLLVVFLLGLLGTVSGQVMAFKAVATAAPEYKQAMMASGISVSMYTTALALMWMVLGALGTGLAATVRRNLEGADRPAAARG